jgi:CheY-like chemotaxis protein/nitrogen-specific signal transduction histidine kinase
VDGRKLGAVVIMHDITNQRQAEEERLHLIEEREARKAAEKSNQIKDEFLATLSHELRTPLTAILGWTQMLQTGRLAPEDVNRAMGSIERNAQAQLQLIEDLLDVSRIITGKMRIEVAPVELAEVVGAAVDSVRPAAEAKHIRLQVLLDPQAGPVSGDAARLQQLVWNLLSNAVKFTPKDGRVQVRLERVNSHVEITVTDSGQGIDADFLPHIFDRFRQADQTSTRNFGGLGLGLSIVHQLVELHGGTIRAESAGEGQGATFVVQLPLMVAQYLPGETERRHPTARSMTGSHNGLSDCPPQLNHLRILVVDDEDDTRDLLRAILESCGSEVATAASAAEAVELFPEWKPDVLISDIGMPGEDGYSLIGKVRALEAQHGGRVPAIALTAYARVEDRVRALMAGFQVHVPKPVEPVELMAVVASLAGRTGV